MPQLIQLQTALSSCKILDSIRKHLDLWRPVFVPGLNCVIEPVEFLDGIVVNYSTSQRHREAEADVFKYFCDVIQKLDSTDG